MPWGPVGRHEGGLARPGHRARRLPPEMSSCWRGWRGQVFRGEDKPRRGTPNLAASFPWSIPRAEAVERPQTTRPGQRPLRGATAVTSIEVSVGLFVVVHGSRPTSSCLGEVLPAVVDPRGACLGRRCRLPGEPMLLRQRTRKIQGGSRPSHLRAFHDRSPPKALVGSCTCGTGASFAQLHDEALLRRSRGSLQPCIRLRSNPDDLRPTAPTSLVTPTPPTFGIARGTTTQA